MGRSFSDNRYVITDPNCLSRGKEVFKERKETERKKDIPLVHPQQLPPPCSVLICPNCMKHICSWETQVLGGDDAH